MGCQRSRTFEMNFLAHSASHGGMAGTIHSIQHCHPPDVYHSPALWQVSGMEMQEMLLVIPVWWWKDRLQVTSGDGEPWKWGHQCSAPLRVWHSRPLSRESSHPEVSTCLRAQPQPHPVSPSDCSLLMCSEKKGKPADLAWSHWERKILSERQFSSSSNFPVSVCSVLVKQSIRDGVLLFAWIFFFWLFVLFWLLILGI